MPRIFDNLAPSSSLLPALQDTLTLSSRADFCVGYFNLRGWGHLAPYVDQWDPNDGPCRVLIGMQRLPHEELREALSLLDRPAGIDNQTANRLKVQLAEQLRQQLTTGVPTNADERSLRQLANQLRSKKVVVKLFLCHPLHEPSRLVADPKASGHPRWAVPPWYPRTQCSSGRSRGSSYLATESPFLAAGYHITYHFGLYLYQFLYQLFLRCISPCSPYNTNFFWRLCHKRMPSRDDEKGGDGMSISASSVTLAASSSSSVKSDAGWPGAGVFGAGRP